MEFLQTKFRENTSPPYSVDEILIDDLNEEREEDHKRVFKTVPGSSTFHVMIFEPNISTFKASTRLCLCSQCKSKYGSCLLFIDYSLQVQELNTTSLRSRETASTNVIDNDEVNDFIVPGTYVALRATDIQMPVWFVKVTEVDCINLQESVTDDYGNHIPKGMKFISGIFLEKDSRMSSFKDLVFFPEKKVTFFYKESVVYPFVNIREEKKGLSLSLLDYGDIIRYVEEMGYAHL